MHSGTSLEATPVKVQLRGLIGLQCVFVYCMSWKTWTPKSLGFRGDNGDLAPFHWDFSGQPASSKFKVRLFPQLLCGDTL